MRLVLVHGRSQEGKDSQALKRVWMDGLIVGLEAAGLGGIDAHEVVFPFYGDDLAAMVAEIHETVDDAVTYKGGDADAAPLDGTQVELLQEVLTDGEIAFETEGRVTHKGLMNTALAHALARAADRTSFGHNFLKVWTEDVALYLSNRAVARRIDDRVQASIGDQPCVVVAHSLGSIVAYRVLRAMGRAARVRRLITIGSPLGLQTVRNLLSPPVRTFPEGVESWVNAFDVKDIVALHPLDAKTWPVDPPITNHAGVANHMDNHHNISGYLDDPYIAAAIHEALNSV